MTSGLSDLRRLQVLSDLIRDSRLEAVKQAAQAEVQTCRRLEALSQNGAALDLHPAAAHAASLAYESWAELRRRELLVTLARQRAELAEAEAAARDAFGRAEAIKSILGRLGD
ncbi:hypothetical protein [Neotabrizicola shimadae]|uniref:Uncharacterized protein n=1 Tax=Neotabrizicola shimadae TaxID=2807096 RepID=A0A8G0ZQX6_9RHOB|nr:hypothetical protein [Neotabrizicola shimadae]QYZ69811.1 hypothetical protein JO391_19285 [Neotabrizicola shimadae]